MIQRDASEDRKIATGAISSGCPNRPNGVCEMRCTLFSHRCQHSDLLNSRPSPAPRVMTPSATRPKCPLLVSLVAARR